MKRKVPSFIPNLWVGVRKVMASCVTFVLIAYGITTQAQPVPLKIISANSNNFTTVHGNVYFNSGDSLWRSNGTVAGTVFVKKTGEPFVAISSITLGNNFFFITQTGSQQSLWKSNGTAPYTIKVATYNSIVPLIVYNNTLYLRINDGIRGSELWKLTANNAVSLVRDINPGIGNGLTGGVITSNNTLFFFGRSATGQDLWRSNGTTGGTSLAANLGPDNFNGFGDFHGLTDVNGTMFFTRSRIDTVNWSGDVVADLWKTDGTQNGTVPVKAFEPVTTHNNLQHLIELNGKLYFIHNYGVPERDLVVSDGTEAGTQFVYRVGIDGSVIKMIKLNNQLVFFDETQGFPGDIRVSDGTTAGTYELHSLSLFTMSFPFDWVNLTGAGDMLFFVDSSTPGPFGNDLELWQSDLTVQNTRSLKSIFGTSFNGADNVAAIGNNILFTTPAPGAGLRLWYYDPTLPLQCAGTGGIVREVWTGIPGQNVSQIPVNTPPSSQGIVTTFAGPVNAGDQYGSRYRGFLCVKETGAYTFYIASDDKSELWLSSTADPINKTKIASVDGYTNPGQYNKYPSQTSSAINLVKGQLYYIEALHKEGLGRDHFSVAFKHPDGTLESPVQGTSLIPYNDATSTTQSPIARAAKPEGTSDPETKREAYVSPNPASSGPVTLTLSGYDWNELNVEVTSMIGAVVYSRSFSCDGDCGSVTLGLDGVLAPGVYVVSGVAGGERFSRRLVVR